MGVNDLNAKELIELYPFLKINNSYYNSEKEITWLDFMPQGWVETIGLPLCRELKDKLNELNMLEDYEVFQVKEKYGELRWYDNGNDEIENIIDKYTTLSKNTCAECGKPAVILTKGYILPLCNKCRIRFGYTDPKKYFVL